MLYFSLFLAGFTVGIFAALKVFAPESREEAWDPQHLPANALHGQLQAGFPNQQSAPNASVLVSSDNEKQPVFPSTKPALA